MARSVCGMCWYIYTFDIPSVWVCRLTVITTKSSGESHAIRLVLTLLLRLHSCLHLSLSLCVSLNLCILWIVWRTSKLLVCPKASRYGTSIICLFVCSSIYAIWVIKKKIEIIIFLKNNLRGNWFSLCIDGQRKWGHYKHTIMVCYLK